MQYAKVLEFKYKEMKEEMQERLDRSSAESVDLTERPLNCPYCGWYIATLFSDSAGHFKAKCRNCKKITVFNVGYFCRSKRR